MLLCDTQHSNVRQLHLRTVITILISVPILDTRKLRHIGISILTHREPCP